MSSSSTKLRLTGILGSSLPASRNVSKFLKEGCTIPSQFTAHSSLIGNNAGLHAHRCTARKANPSCGGGAKPKGLLAGRKPGCRTAAAGPQSSAFREGERMQPHTDHGHKIYTPSGDPLFRSLPRAVRSNLCKWAKPSWDHPLSRVVLPVGSAFDSILSGHRLAGLGVSD
jgi:hypothetical protein